MLKLTTGAFEQRHCPFGTGLDSGEFLYLAQVPVLLSEQGMSQFWVGSLETLPLYLIVQKVNLFLLTRMNNQANANELLSLQAL